MIPSQLSAYVVNSDIFEILIVLHSLLFAFHFMQLSFPVSLDYLADQSINQLFRRGEQKQQENASGPLTAYCLRVAEVLALILATEVYSFRYQSESHKRT